MITSTTSTGFFAAFGTSTGDVTIHRLEHDVFVPFSSFHACDDEIASVSLSSPEYGQLIAVLPRRSSEVLIFDISSDFVASLEISSPGTQLQFAPDSFKLYVITGKILFIFGIDVNWAILDEIEFEEPLSNISVLPNSIAFISHGSVLNLVSGSASGASSIVHSEDLYDEISAVCGSPLFNDHRNTAYVCTGLINGSVMFLEVELSRGSMTKMTSYAAHKSRVVDLKWSMVGDVCVSSGVDSTTMSYSLTPEFGFEQRLKIVIE
ncbi:hypothetical protein RCL1_006802 [Eukaryota sp. TZLM3-RCL]